MATESTFLDWDEGTRGEFELWLNQMMQLIENSLTGRREDWDLYLRLYKSQPDKKVKTFPWEGASNIFWPEIANSVETISAFIISNVVEQTPMRIVKPLKKETEDVAPLFEQFMDVYGKDEPQNLKAYWRRHLPHFALLGTHICKPYIETEGLEEFPSIKFEGIPLHNFYCFPGIKEISDQPVVGDLSVVPLHTIRNWQKEIGDEFFPKSALSQIISQTEKWSSQGEPKSDERREQGDIPPGFTPVIEAYCTWNREVPDPLDPNEMTIESHEVKTVFQYYADTITVMWVESWPAKERRYIKGYMEEDEDSFFGRGLGDRTWTLQVGLNTGINQGIDNATVANVRVWAVATTAGVGDNETMYPGRIIRIPDPKGVVPLSMGDIYPSVYNNLSHVFNAFQRSAATPENMLGMDSTIVKTRQTAMGQAMNIQEGARRINFRSWGFESVIVDMFWMTAEMLAEYVTQDEIDLNQLPEPSEGVDEMISIFDSMETRGSFSTIKSIMERSLSEEEANTLESKVFSIRDVVKNRKGFKVVAARRSENQQLERQAAMVVSQLVAQYLEKVIVLAEKLVQVQQMPGGEIVANTIAEAWRVSNITMKRVLTKFPLEDVADMLISLQDVQGSINAIANNQPVGNVPGQNVGPPGAANQGGNGGLSSSGILGAISGMEGAPSGVGNIQGISGSGVAEE